jgi:hypothetical protein
VTQAMTRRGMAPLALGAAAACGLVLPAHAGDGGGGEDVSATEDLMREHGVLRRTLIVYAELVPRLRARPEAVDAGALAEAATLFRTFGEDYHERSLEEQHVFPEVGRTGGDTARLVEALLVQHQRGRGARRDGERAAQGGDGEMRLRTAAHGSPSPFRPHRPAWNGAGTDMGAPRPQ